MIKNSFNNLKIGFKSCLYTNLTNFVRIRKIK